MSLADTQEIYNMLVECVNVINGINTGTEKIVAQTPQLEKHELSLQKEVRTLNILIMTMERFTGATNISDAINTVQRFMQILMRLRMTILALEAASGPWGWLYVGANVLATGMMLYDSTVGGI